MIETENWKIISVATEYEVSDQGQIRNKTYQNIRKLEITKKYKFCRIRLNDVRYDVDLLVAQAFLPNPYNSSRIYHKNKDWSDNRVDNLTWTFKKQKRRDYNISYFTAGKHHVYFESTGVIKILDKIETNTNNFKLLTFNENHASDNDLLEYAKMFKQRVE